MLCIVVWMFSAGNLRSKDSYLQARSHGGGARGAQPPLEKFEPPPLGCAVPFAVTIGIEVYPPPLEFCQPPPLLTIPGYRAAYLSTVYFRLM